MSTKISTFRKSKKNADKIYLGNPSSQWPSSTFTDEEWQLLQEGWSHNKEIVTFRYPGRRTLVVNTHTDHGPSDEAERLRALGSKALEKINDEQIASVEVYNFSGEANAGLHFVEGLALRNYQFLKYFNKPEGVYPLKEIRMDASVGNSRDASELENLVRANHVARDLVNEPLSYLTAEQFSKEMEKLGKESGFKVTVFKKKKIESLKMGGLLAVNRGSGDPPTFNILEWKPKNHQNKKPIVLVGKGVVYDTGGLSLKPTPNSMDKMKCDMAGAAVVVSTIYAIAKNKLPLYVVALVPATDNRPGYNAYAPGDVINMYDGSTVEVLNTDAEGRMILADALTYAKRYKPSLVIDLATLTGSAARAIGEYGMVGMGTAGEEVMKRLIDSGKKTYERVVEFPLWEEYREDLKSDIADIKNVGPAEGGAITAGKFLEHFTEYPWIHLDIAGPSFLKANSAYRPKNGSGYGVRLIYHFVKNNAKDVE